MSVKGVTRLSLNISSVPPPKPVDIGFECNNFETLNNETGKMHNITVNVPSKEFVKR